MKRDNSIYEEEGYANRQEYLRGLAEEFGVSETTVFMMADVLGENEDFDGLVTELEDNYHLLQDEW